MGHVKNADGSLTINPTPDTVADLQAISNQVMELGGLLKGTSTQRSQLTGSQLRAGWVFSETDTGALYKWSSSGWDLVWSDSGWQALTNPTGFTPLDGVLSAYRIIGRTVYVRVSVEGSIPNNAVTNVATGLPAGARPSPSTGIVRSGAQLGQGGFAGGVTAYPVGHVSAGAVGISNYTGGARGWASATFSYPLG